MKPSKIEETLNFMIQELVITPAGITNSHRMLSKGYSSCKMTVKLPCVEFEKKSKRNWKSSRKTPEISLAEDRLPERSRSFSRISIRKPAIITPHLVEMNFEESVHHPNFKCISSQKRIKSMRMHTAKERSSNEPFDSAFSCKVSNLIIGLPYTENKNSELKRSAHRLRKLQRRIVRFDKENELFN